MMWDAIIACPPPYFQTLILPAFNGYVTGNKVSFSLGYRFRAVVNRRPCLGTMQSQNLKEMSTNLQLALGMVLSGEVGLRLYMPFAGKARRKSFT